MIKLSLLAVALLFTTAACTTTDPYDGARSAAAPPRHRVDAAWPKPLPENWILGQVSGLAVDRRDHVWVLRRPLSILKEELGATQTPPATKCCVQAPAVIESEGSNSTRQLGRPAHMDTDLAAGEVYIADGYGNRRVAVFDARSGAYKRHWGAYGKPPHDKKLPPYSPTAPGSESFNNAVHCVRLSRDGLVYVCDRRNNRVQVFKKDGTFVREFFVERETRTGQTVAEIAFSPDRRQRLMYVADGPNGEVQVLNRADGKPVASFGRIGPMAGQFRNLHNIASDSRGNIYTAEAGWGRRVQKFVPVRD